MEDFTTAGVEQICNEIYNPSDMNKRQMAEQMWQEFCQNQQNKGHLTSSCLTLLLQSDNPYCNIVVLSTITKFMTSTAAVFSISDKKKLCACLIQILLANSPSQMMGDSPLKQTTSKKPDFVKQAIYQLYSVIVKQSWLDVEDDDFPFRDSLADARQLFMAGRQIEGLRLLTHVVVTINVPESPRMASRHRKISALFRDEFLLDIFKVGLNSVREQNLSYIEPAFKLIQACLAFDFLGMMSDESTEEITIIQAPIAWRALLAPPDESTSQEKEKMFIIPLFFKIYINLADPELAAQALSICASLIAVRRSLFTLGEKQRYLQSTVHGVLYCLENPSHLSHPDCYHAFCRLLVQLKANFQLAEIIKCDGYAMLIPMLTDFSIQSLEAWQFAPNSVHYLLMFWNRLVSSIPYLKSQEPHNLNDAVPRVVQAYLTSRLKSVEEVVRSNGVLDDPLEDYSVIEQQMESLSNLGRFEYIRTCEILEEILEQATNLSGFLVQDVNTYEFKITVGKLTWWVYMVGALVGGRLPFVSADDEDFWDGKLVCKVCHLMRINIDAEEQTKIETLEVAYLSFLENFRRIYIGDQIQRHSNLFVCLSEQLSISDELDLFELFVSKIIINLSPVNASPKVVRMSLKLFDELSVGYMSIRKLVTLPRLEFILNGQAPKHFPFLQVETGSGNEISKARTLFYQVVGRLIAVDLPDNETHFCAVMGSLEKQAHQLKLALQSNNQPLIIGHGIALARDLLGLAIVFTSKQAYHLLFEFLHPTCFDLFAECIQRVGFEGNGKMLSKIIRLFSELTYNRQQRLQFDSASPHVYILFRCVSRIICMVGEGVLAQVEMDSKTPNQPLIANPSSGTALSSVSSKRDSSLAQYGKCIKPIELCVAMLRNSICGLYINFGVFRLYQDPCLDNAMSMVCRLVQSVPDQELMSFPKLAQVYLNLMDTLSGEHTSVINSLPLDHIKYLLTVLLDGFSSPDLTLSTSCCSILEELLTLVFRTMSVAAAEVARNSNSSLPSSPTMNNGNNATGPSWNPVPVTPSDMSRLLRGKMAGVSQESALYKLLTARNSTYMYQSLACLMNIVIFEQCQNVWSISRPLLLLILLNRSYFNQLKQEVLSCQPPSRQSAMTTSFDKLLDGVEDNSITVVNRDKFTQNLNVFKREIGELLQVAAAVPSDNDPEGGDLRDSTDATDIIN